MYFLSLAFLLLVAPEAASLQPPATTGWTRRDLFSAATITTVATMFPALVQAVPPLTDGELGRMKSKMMKGKVPGDKVQRQPLAMDFAVLLTRSSYAEADQLDVVPVNQLERDMYLVRTEEYQPYKEKVGSLKQGDLTDPSYFDFMSGVQYFVINRAIQDPEVDFEEMQPEASEMEDGSVPKLKKVRVHRTLPDDKLVQAHDERVGTSVLDYFYDTYRGTPIALPEYQLSTATPTSRPGIDQVQAALEQLVKIFLINGFAWEGQVDRVKNNGGKSASFILSLQAPATLWSGQSLDNQSLPLRNDFLLKTAKQLVKSMGYVVASSSVKFKGDSELSFLTIV